MVTDHDIERRCRYRLERNGLRFHKIKGDRGPVYYVYEIGKDEPAPDDDGRYMDLSGLLDFVAQLAER